MNRDDIILLLDQRFDTISKENTSVQDLMDDFLIELVVKEYGEGILNKPLRLTNEEMDIIVNDPFSTASPVQFNKLTSGEYALCPMFRQTKALLKIIDEAEELKLTAIGNLPPKIVKELYPLGVKNWFIEEAGYKLSKETDSESVQVAHILATISGVAKKRNNKLSLTANGKKLLNDDYALFMKLFSTYCMKFNWAYFDSYEFEGIGKFGFAYSLYLISIYGDKQLPDNFYADKFFDTFSRIRNMYDFGENGPQLSGRLNRCYRTRVFTRSFYMWGLIDKAEMKYLLSDLVWKTEFFDKLIKMELAGFH